MKIAVVGGGSTYTPELVSGLSRERDRIDVTELALHDIDAERRDVVGEMAARMLEKQGFGGKLVVTSDLDLALDGADFVLVQIRVGGQTARLSDETIPLACGCIGQETTGAGGLAKALRTVPVVLEIADRVRERAAADAWIVDFTNPVGIVTRALLDAGHRAVGLCNVAIGLQRAIAGMLELAPQRVVVDQVGLNHLTWVRRVLVDETMCCRHCSCRHGTELAGHVGLPRQILDELGAIPSYYLRYFYAHDQVLAEQIGGIPRAAAVAEIERELLELYRDPELAEKPKLLEQRGGAFYSEAATGLVASLVSGSGEVHEVDLRNDGTIAGLADDDVVEVPARMIDGAPAPSPSLHSHPSCSASSSTSQPTNGSPSRRHSAATLSTRRHCSPPLIGQWDVTDELVRLLLEADVAHLPRFAAALGARG